MPVVREGSRLRPPQSIREEKVKEVSDLFHHQTQVAYPGGEAAVAAHSYSTIRPGIGRALFFQLRLSKISAGVHADASHRLSVRQQDYRGLLGRLLISDNPAPRPETRSISP
jgi:hypothetical protein